MSNVGFPGPFGQYWYSRNQPREGLAHLTPRCIVGNQNRLTNCVHNSRRRLPKHNATTPDHTYRLRDNSPFVVYSDILERVFLQFCDSHVDKVCVSPCLYFRVSPCLYFRVSPFQFNTHIKIIIICICHLQPPAPHSPFLVLRLPHSSLLVLRLPPLPI